MSEYRIVVLLFCGLLFAFPAIAQNKANLARLAAQLKDRDAGVRRSAIESIGQLTDPTAADLLLPALNDDNQEVRSAAALALGQLNAAQSCPI
jgi:HEAT repeat protein